MPPILLHADRLTKAYAGTTVLDQVSLSVPQGQVVSVVGENGAGKSTLLNLISGIVRPDAGRLTFDGAEVAPEGYGQAMRLGISRVFQEQALVANVAVYENLLLSLEARYAAAGQFMRRRRMIEVARSLMAEADLDIEVTQATHQLSFSRRQLLEILRACLVPLRVLGVERPLVLLDEPTASLEKADEEVFFRLIAALRGQVSFVFVSHRLTEVLQLSDRIFVLKDGCNVAELDSKEASEEQLHSLMVGRERIADYYHEERQGGFAAETAAAVAIKDLGDGRSYHDVNLSLQPGEVLGVGGLVASGTAELGRGVAGVVPPGKGSLRLGEGGWQTPRIGRLIRQGVGYVPAERLAAGMIPSFPLSWNLSLAGGQDHFVAALGFWRGRLEAEVATDYIKRLRIRARRHDQRCATLSGGNQQKVVLARWLCRKLRFLVLDNPTRGVDAGAKEEIYGFIRDLTEEGVAILLITDDLPELIGLSDRIAIMRHGRVTAEMAAPAERKPGEQEILALMLDDAGDASGYAA